MRCEAHEPVCHVLRLIADDLDCLIDDYTVDYVLYQIYIFHIWYLIFGTLVFGQSIFFIPDRLFEKDKVHRINTNISKLFINF